MIQKTLTDLVSVLPDVRRSTSENPVITHITHDSRQVQPSSLFVCIEGLTTDGHHFIDAAIERGAVAILASRPVAEHRVPVIYVNNTRAALPVLAAALYDHPSRQLNVIGITGTNGKTTSTYLIRSLFEVATQKTGLIGTIAYWIGADAFEAPFTTPESIDIQRLFAEMVKQHVQTVIMEVSSHALELRRADAIDFDTAIFTNLTRDHLDFHSSVEAYRNAKLRLFQKLTDPQRQRGIVNLDDPNASYFIKQTPVPVLTFGFSTEADIHPLSVQMTLFHTDLELRTPLGTLQLRSPLRGRSNIYNLLTTVTVGIAYNMSLETIRAGIEQVENVAGRFETVDEGQDFGVIVDYAHTPDALERLLKTVREIGVKRIITVFGCGGDRDRGKRPQMGQIAANLSDWAIVTSDNPRTEDPNQIIADILEGISTSNIDVEIDRRKAIYRAVEIAQTGDAVVIAGKGHEDYQILGTTKTHFDDREEARKALKAIARTYQTSGDNQN
ncbi:MAG: UDP-N-acetylmuramoyl-L-alanyl-D-glutamate--2,6-diaminopimelate ligase [Gemmatimonadetes bacterium]|nr:MAG: UDP-N-acetylmuramoyl-L-alanyl-D-glutamate--2,6-diaminopimelate ligase [Gemmatimonadota bacterium]